MFRLGKLLFLLLMTGSLAHAQDVISDRLVLEVNNISYSQRQFEIYMALKSILKKEDNQPVLVNSGNWEPLLEQYRYDMMLEQEAQRLGSFQATRKLIEAALRVVDERRSKDILFNNFLQRMGASDLSVRRSLASVVRVRAFIISKQRQAFSDNTPIEKEAVLNKNADWFIRLQQRVPFRLYEGAQKYRRIEPGQAFKKT